MTELLKERRKKEDFVIFDSLITLEYMCEFLNL